MWHPTGWRIVSSEGLTASGGPIVVGVGLAGGSFFLDHECGYQLRLVFIAGQASYGISPPLEFSWSARSMASVALGQIYGWNRRALCGRDFEGEFVIHVGGEASLLVGANACVISFGKQPGSNRCVAVGSYLATSLGAQAGASAGVGYGRVLNAISGQGHLPREYAEAAHARR